MKKRYHSFWFINVLLYSLATIMCTENLPDFAQKEEVYRQVMRNELNERIVQKRKTIQERPRQQWLWNTARIVGPLGLMALGAYQWFKRAPSVEQPTEEFKKNNPLSMESLPVIQQETFSQFTESELEPFVPAVQDNKPIIQADVSKYTQASKAYGAAAVWFTLNALFDPFFYPYVAATYMGSLYYAVKALRPRLKPIALEEIAIIPDELHYY